MLDSICSLLFIVVLFTYTFKTIVTSIKEWWKCFLSETYTEQTCTFERNVYMWFVIYTSSDFYLCLWYIVDFFYLQTELCQTKLKLGLSDLSWVIFIDPFTWTHKGVFTCIFALICLFLYVYVFIVLIPLHFLSFRVMWKKAFTTSKRAWPQLPYLDRGLLVSWIQFFIFFFSYNPQRIGEIWGQRF